MTSFNDIPQCSCCGQAPGRKLTRVWLCDDCLDILRGRQVAVNNEVTRLGRTVTACSKELADIMVMCTNVILSNGRDQESMARALNDRDAIVTLDRVLNEIEYGEEKSLHVM